MSHDFPAQDLPLRADLTIRRGNYFHRTLTATQPDGSDVSWAGYTAALVLPAGSGVGSVALNPAAVDAPGAGEITLEIDTKLVAEDVRGKWSITVTKGGQDTTIWQGRLVVELRRSTQLAAESGCGLDIAWRDC